MNKVSLKTYIYAVFFSILVVSVLFIFLFFYVHILHKFERIEKNLFISEVKDFVKELHMIEDNIDDIATEWTIYDTSLLLKKKLKDLLNSLEIDGVILLSGQKANILAVNPKFKNETYKLIYLLRYNSKRLIKNKGIVRLNRISAIVSYKRIKRKTQDYIVVFKFLSEDFLKSISSYETIKLTNETYNGKLKEINLSVKFKDFQINFYEIGKFRYFARILTKDIFGNKVLFANAYINRIIKAQMFQTLIEVLVFLISMTVLGIIFLIYTFSELTFTSLNKTITFLKKAINKKDFSKRLNIDFNSREFSKLKEEINLLFKTIQNQINTIQDQQKLFETIAENIPTVIYLYSDKFEYVNSKIEEFFGIKKEEFLQKNVYEFIEEIIKDKEILKEAKKSILRRKKGEVFTNRFSISYKDNKGEEKYFMIIENTIFIKNKPYGMGIIFDITERKKLENQLRKLALTDPLTGLLNRNGFFNEVQILIDIYERQNKELYVLLFDLNKFKFINDQYGHNIGDILLKEIANRLKSSLRKSDVVARLGGDEFAVVIPVVSKEEDIVIVVEKIISEVEKPIKIDSFYTKPSTSIGISIFPKDGQDIETLLKRADIAMYKAKEKSKQTGKSEYVFFSQSLEIQLRRKIEMEKELEKSLILEEGLEVYYQPIVDENLNVVKVEGLLRWKSKKFGYISPAEFIPLAEEVGIITKLTDFVLKQVKKDINNWINKGINSIKVSINISPLDIKDVYFLDRINLLLQNFKDKISIEITENIFLNFTEEEKNFLNKLKEDKIEISLDDFGTGYSSLVYLKKYPIDILKIDKSFIENIESKKEDRSIVITFVELAKILNMKVIAEGVETLEQFYFLKEIKVDYFQGFLFGKPMPADKIEHLLLKGKIDIDEIR